MRIELLSVLSLILGGIALSYTIFLVFILPRIKENFYYIAPDADDITQVAEDSLQTETQVSVIPICMLAGCQQPMFAKVSGKWYCARHTMQIAQSVLPFYPPAIGTQQTSVIELPPTTVIDEVGNGKHAAE